MQFVNGPLDFTVDRSSTKKFVEDRGSTKNSKRECMWRQSVRVTMQLQKAEDDHGREQR